MRSLPDIHQSFDYFHSVKICRTLVLENGKCCNMTIRNNLKDLCSYLIWASCFLIHPSDRSTSCFDAFKNGQEGFR